MQIYFRCFKNINTYYSSAAAFAAIIIQGNTKLSCTACFFKNISCSKILFQAFRANSNAIDVKPVQSCLGHSTATTTLQIYAHTFQAAQIRAMDTVANTISMKKASNE